MAKIDLSRFSEEQIIVAQMLANKDSNGLTVNQIAQEASLNPRTVYRWQLDEEFIELLNYYAELSMEAYIPELYGQLKKSARTGSTRAMELILKNRGKLIDKKEIAGNIDVTAHAATLSSDQIMLEIEALKKKINAQKDLPQLPSGGDE